MSAGLSAFLNILVIAFEQLMVCILSEGMFKRRFSAPLTLCLFIVSALPVWFVYSLMAEHMYLRIVLGCIFMSAMVLLSFRTNAVKAVFTGAFIGAFLQLADTALIAAVCEWLGISVQYFLFGPFEYYALCFFIKTVELFFIIALQFILRHRFPGRAASVSDWIRALAFPASSFVISMLLLHSVIAAPEATKELLVCVIIVLLTDVMSFFVLNYMDRQSEAVRDNAILRHNIKLELDNITAWREAYSGQRKLTHDYQNQLLVIRGMVEQDAARSDLLSYLDGLQAQLTPAETLVNTHRPAADIIINQKLSIAKSKDISFRYQLDDLSTVSLPDDELVTVLANLIDNAIEACEEISEPEKRHILLKFKVKDEAAFLYIENSTAKPVRVRNNVVQTTKDNAAGHGFGLQNVAAVLAKHGGIYAISYDAAKKLFIFSAQI